MNWMVIFFVNLFTSVVSFFIGLVITGSITWATILGCLSAVLCGIMLPLALRRYR